MLNRDTVTVKRNKDGSWATYPKGNRVYSGEDAKILDKLLLKKEAVEDPTVKWQSIDNIPLSKLVWLKTVSGLTCQGYHKPYKCHRNIIIYRGEKRVRCKRDDHVKGDVSAVAWKEI